jgi:hypothetical protein
MTATTPLPGGRPTARASIFLGSVSAGLVALGFAGQGGDSVVTMRAIALVLFLGCRRSSGSFRCRSRTFRSASEATESAASTWRRPQACAAGWHASRRPTPSKPPYARLASSPGQDRSRAPSASSTAPWPACGSGWRLASSRARRWCPPWWGWPRWLAPRSASTTTRCAAARRHQRRSPTRRAPPPPLLQLDPTAQLTSASPSLPRLSPSTGGPSQPHGAGDLGGNRTASPAQESLARPNNLVNAAVSTRQDRRETQIGVSGA